MTTTPNTNEEADERKNLETFLSDRQLSLEQITQRMGNDNFQAFFKELVALKKILSIATLQSQQTKNIEHVGYILGAGAKVQKDTVYLTLFQALRGPIRHDFNPVTRLHYVAALQDYVLQQYDQGVEQCAQILEH